MIPKHMEISHCLEIILSNLLWHIYDDPDTHKLVGISRKY